MKISILLPYKENFSPIYAGAVSLFVKDTVKISKYKNNITIYGNTNLKKIYNLKYSNLDLKKDLLASQSKTYVDRFIEEETRNKSDIIEVHNRPIYIKYLINEKVDSNFVLYFHNDPLSMTGSKTINDRKLLLSKCEKIIFNSQWSKKRFLQGIKSSFINSDKLLVIYQSAKRSKIDKTKKLKWITFVGKLNKSKGYDIYGNAVCKILDKYKDWRGIVIGDEQRDKIIFQHKNLKILGFLKHEKVLDILSKTSIAVACSRWDEPLGRTSLEASSKGCAVIISNKGGLPETVTNAIILQKLDRKILFKKLMCFGVISQQPPNKDAPWFAAFSTYVLKILGVKSAFFRVPRAFTGLVEETSFITKSLGIFSKALILNPYGRCVFLNSGNTRSTVSGEVQAAIIPQQL